MNDQTYEPKAALGHCDQISRLWDFALYFGIQLVYEHTFYSLFACAKTFDLKLILGYCGLISWFSDFALYLDTQMV